MSVEKKNNKKYKRVKNKSNANRNGNLAILQENVYLRVLRMLPVILMVIMVPFILRRISNPLEYPVSSFWTTEIEYDLYTYGKTIAIMLLTLLMISISFVFTKKEMWPSDRVSKIVYASTALFLISSIISTFTSDYRQLAVWGAPERHEGLIIHISYLIILIYTYINIRNEKDFEYIRNSLFFLATGMALIGISQALGKNIVNSDFVRRLIIPAAKYDVLEKIDTGNTVYLTLMNPNYVGSYASMMVVFLSSVLLSSGERTNIRIVSFILTILTVFVLIKSGSQAGVVGIISGLFVLFLVNIKTFGRYPKRSVAAMLIIIILIIGTDFVTKGAIKENVTGTVTDAVSLFTKDSDYVHDPSYGFAVKDINLSGDIVEIETDTGTFRMIFTETGKLEFRDQDNNDISAGYNLETTSYLLKEPFSSFSFAVSKASKEHHVQAALLYQGRYYFIFEWYLGEGIQMIDHRGNLYEWGSAPYIGFEGKEKIGSKRGYIWSRTLPLITEKPLFGYGPDTFLMNFPQHDMLAKNYVYDGQIAMLTDKPHNMYLLYAINSGLIGLGSALVLWGTYVFSSLKTLLKTKSRSRVYYYSMGCLGAVSAYLATGMFNDSVPVIAPVFWVILGSGYALNYILRNEDVEVAKDEKQAI